MNSTCDESSRSKVCERIVVIPGNGHVLQLVPNVSSVLEPLHELLRMRMDWEDHGGSA